MEAFLVITAIIMGLLSLIARLFGLAPKKGASDSEENDYYGCLFIIAAFIVILIGMKSCGN